MNKPNNTNEFNQNYKRTTLKFLSEKIRKNQGFNIIVVLLVSFLLRFPMCFVFGSLLDLPRYTLVGDYLNMGLNPYLDHISWPISFYNKYPALFFELLGTWFFIFGNSAFSLRILLLIFDLGSIYYMYKIGTILKSEEMGVNFALLYSLFPFNFLDFLQGENDAIPMFFMILAIYYYLKNAHLKAGFWLAMGICFKIYPIFFLFALLLFKIKKQEYKQAIQYLIILTIVFFLTSLPFLIMSPIEYIESILVHTHRKSTGNAFSDLLPGLFETIPITIPFISITFSWNFLLQISIIGVFSLYCLFNHRERPVKRMEVFIWTACFLVFLPIITFRGILSNWVWVSPFFIILFYDRELIFLERKKKSVIILIIYYIFLIGALIYYNNSIPFSIFQSYLQWEGMENYIIQFGQEDRIFTYIIGLKLLTYIIYSILFFEKRIEKIPAVWASIFNFGDWSIQFIMNQFIDDPIWKKGFIGYLFIRLFFAMVIFISILLINQDKRRK